MRNLGLAALVFALTTQSACTIYFGDDDDDDDDCVNSGSDLAPAIELRDPQTGTCQAFGGGGGGGCDPVPLAEGEAKAPFSMPDWATCQSGCEGLDELSCQLSDGCRAIYVDAESCGPQGCMRVNIFAACWGVAPSGPVQGGACEGLDAHECSRHNDCSAVHQGDPVVGGVGGFSSCIREGDKPCGGNGAPYPGALLRNPQSGKCENFGGGGCLPKSGDGLDASPIPPFPDWGVCQGACTGLDEATCGKADGCRAVYIDVCPPWAVCAPTYQYKECWATAPTGPVRGGDCTTLGAYECSRHDDCAPRHAGDWTTCPPGGPCTVSAGTFVSCGAEGPPPPPPPPPAPKCADIDSEALCIDMYDGCVKNGNGTMSCGDKCQPIYEGSDCSCTPQSCTCQTWTFIDCQVQ
jgi:hypothetical protein